MFHFLGIDPGLSGAIAVLDADGQCVTCADTPVLTRVDTAGRDRRDYALADMRALLLDVAGTLSLTAIEAVHAFPEQGVASTFALGRGFGIWLGMLGALRLSFLQVYPVRWKTRFSLLREGKQAARIMAQQRWPGVALHLKKHDGRADALFLAEYARQTHLGLTKDRSTGATTQGDDDGDHGPQAA
jgi:hypothetical protein